MAKNVRVKIEKLVWHFSPKVPQCNFFIECRKLAHKQKVLKQLCQAELGRGSKQKNQFDIFSSKVLKFFFFTERWVIIPQTKSFQTTLRLLAILRIKKPFFSKKCIFWPENDVFSKKSFYSKLISDQNYIICTCQKKYFQNKIMRLQFSPDST